MADLNPIAWNWTQYKASGRHVASFAAGLIGGAAALHFITPQQATDVNGDITALFTGLEQVATSIAGLIAICVPIYTAFKAAHSASPTMEAKSLVAAEPKTIIVTTPEIAAATPEVSNIVSNTDVKVTTK
jgi:hypothetical protein